MPSRDEIAEILHDNITDDLPTDPFRGEIRAAVENAIDDLFREWPEIADIGRSR